MSDSGATSLGEAPTTVKSPAFKRFKPRRFMKTARSPTLRRNTSKKRRVVFGTSKRSQPEGRGGHPDYSAQGAVAVQAQRRGFEVKQSQGAKLPNPAWSTVKFQPPEVASR